MEEVLDRSAEDAAAPDPRPPLVCLDEKPVVWPAETRPGQPPCPGHAERRDEESRREGTADLCVLVAPHLGWRHGAVTDQRTKLDDADQLRYLAEEAFPDAESIRRVQDNLNTPTLAALDDVFPPERARDLARRFAVHSTPKHGSWLNLAEIEIRIFERGALSRPCPDRETRRQRVAAQEADRNARRCPIHWQFTTTLARTKLHDLYPRPNTKPD